MIATKVLQIFAQEGLAIIGAFALSMGVMGVLKKARANAREEETTPQRKSIWHKASVKPKCKREILCMNRIGRMFLYTWDDNCETWDAAVMNCTLVKWAYLDKVLMQLK